MKVAVRLVKAFTKDPTLGNPAGVVLNARDLNDDQMLTLARHYGFSESSFVQNSEKADFRVRFFSVQQEVDFCGHATVATFNSLVRSGRVVVDGVSTKVTQETKIGILPVTCFSDGKIMMTQRSPEFKEIINDNSVSHMLGLSPDDVGSTPVQIISTGVNKLIIPLRSLSLMRRITPNFKDIIGLGKKYDFSGVAVIATESFSGQADLATRNFSPAVGIDEDPATGIAAGPITCYADKYLYQGRKKKLIIEQGFDMGKASTIYTDISSEVQVGGYAAEFGTEEINI